LIFAYVFAASDAIKWDVWGVGHTVWFLINTYTDVSTQHTCILTTCCLHVTGKYDMKLTW